MLCDFAKKGDVESVKSLLLAGCDPDAADYDARTAMHLACSEGNILIAEALLAHNAGLNKVDRWGGTPLADAVREGHLEMAQLLIDHGAVLGFVELDAAGHGCLELKQYGAAPPTEGRLRDARQRAASLAPAQAGGGLTVCRGDAA